MRRGPLAAAVALSVTLLTASLGHAAAAGAPPTPADEVRVFAAGGTQVSNGLFFPGTAIANGGKYIGEPLPVPQGSNIRFFNADQSTFAGGHKITSFKRIRRGGKSVPLFSSKLVEGPAEALVITSHLEPGIYDYFCSIHSGMFGLIKVQ